MAIVIMEGNRKPHPNFRMVPVSMTFSRSRLFNVK